MLIINSSLMDTHDSYFSQSGLFGVTARKALAVSRYAVSRDAISISSWITSSKIGVVHIKPTQKPVLLWNDLFCPDKAGEGDSGYQSRAHGQ